MKKTIHNDRSGVIEFRFKTDEAARFYDVLKAVGLREGAPEAA